MMANVLAITGAAGYVGRRVLKMAHAAGQWDRIVALDISFRDMPAVPHEQERCDIRQGFSRLLRRHGVTQAVHLVFQVDPHHDLTGMYELNVGGSQRFLEACHAANVRSALMVSSATAYGALPDNPLRMRETHPLRARPSFPYAWHKVLTERLCDAFTREHPDIALATARPCVVVGPRLDNYLSRMMLRPIIFAAHGRNPPMQAVHEDDVAQALVTLLANRARGAYNVAPEDDLTFEHLAHLLDRPVWPLPFPVLRAATDAAWKLRWAWLSEVPPGFLNYIAYPWCVDSSRLCNDFGFEFTYSSRGAFETWAQPRSHPNARHAS